MIHRYWDDPDTTPAHSAWTTKVITNLHPEHELHDWTRDDLPDKLLTLLDELDVNVRHEDIPRHHANIVRWWLLREYGGIWLDHDILPLRNLSSPTRDYTAAVGNERVSCVLSFVRSDLVNKIFDTICNNARNCPPDSTSMEASGDRVLNRFLNPSIWARQLPFRSDGKVNKGLGPDIGEPWAVHFFHTTTDRKTHG